MGSEDRASCTAVMPTSRHETAILGVEKSLAQGRSTSDFRLSTPECELLRQGAQDHFLGRRAPRKVRAAAARSHAAHLLSRPIGAVVWLGREEEYPAQRLRADRDTCART